MKRMIHQTMQWVSAVLVALVICNGLLFLYNRPAGWINRTNSSTNSIWYPGSFILHGTEGRGFHSVDQNGYINIDLPCQADYCVVIGASFTQGKEVASGKRFTDILNDKLAVHSNALAVYNCSQDGYYFPDIVKNFYAITQEFSNAGTLVIEIGSMNFSSLQLLDSLTQNGFDENQTGKNIVSQLSPLKKLSIKVKELFPVYTIFRNQIIAYRNSSAPQMKASEKSADSDASYAAFDKTLSLIRAEWDKELIIIYHPSIEIGEDGSLHIIRENAVDVESFGRLCSKNNIIFIDVSDDFIKSYAQNYAVPYGYSNTRMGSGHLNADGHKVIADALYEILK